MQHRQKKHGMGRHNSANPEVTPYNSGLERDPSAKIMCKYEMGLYSHFLSGCDSDTPRP